jgi:hypothetical protein
MKTTLRPLLSLLPLALLLLATPHAAQAREHHQSPASLPTLLALPAVRQELILTPVQAGLLDSIQADYRKQAGNITAMGMDDEDGALRSEWDIRKLRKQMNARALAVLSDSQQARLLELERQMLDGSLLSSPTEQKLLGLTADQRKQLAALAASSRARASVVSARVAAGQISDFQKGIELRHIQEETSRGMKEVLTADQRTQWKILSGRKSGLPAIHDPNARTESLFEGY